MGTLIFLIASLIPLPVVQLDPETMEGAMDGSSNGSGSNGMIDGSYKH
jgi:hypothetical protein